MMNKFEALVENIMLVIQYEYGGHKNAKVLNVKIIEPEVPTASAGILPFHIFRAAEEHHVKVLAAKK